MPVRLNKTIDSALHREVIAELIVLAHGAKVALQQSDFSRLSSLTHNIRGVAGFYGEHRIAGIGKSMENAIVHKSIVDLDALLTKLKDELSERAFQIGARSTP